MSEERRNGPAAVWQAQPIEAKRLSPEEIRAKAARFERTIRLRNLREYVAAAIVFVVFGVYAWQATTWLARAGHLAIVAGALYVVVQLATRAAPGGGLDDAARVTETCLRFHRRELERQRDLLRSVWRWYLGPLVPGLILIFADAFLRAWTNGGVALLVFVASGLLVVVVFLAVSRLNAAGAQRLQRAIDALGTEP